MPGESSDLLPQLFSARPQCPCGAIATELHHLIPRYWFRLNRLPETTSHFAENLLPVCSDCNQRWYNFSVFAHSAPKYWTQHPEARRALEEKSSAAFAAARAMGIEVYPPPVLQLNQLPGQPVLAKPRDATSSTLQVVALLDVFWYHRILQETAGPRGAAWRGGTLAGQGNPYMVFISWDHTDPVPWLRSAPDPAPL